MDHEAQIVFSPAKYTNILHSNLHTITTSYAKISRPVTQFLQKQKELAKDHLGNQFLESELKNYKDMIIEMKELYNTIPSLPVTHSYPRHKRQVLLAGAVGAGLGAGVALLASLLFENPRQDQIISDLAKTTEAINMLNKDRITFQEQQIIWDNKLMNNIKNTSDRIFR